MDENSSLYLYAIYAPANYDKVQLGFKEEIARFIKDGITEEELKNAVNGWVQAQSVSRAKDNELSSLIIELSKTQKIYFDNRTLLGFSLPDELSDIDREILESQMPILERKIEDLQKIVNEKISEL